VIDGLRRIPNVTIYKRNELPERFHYSKPEHRLGEVFVIPNEGVYFFNVSKKNLYNEYLINFLRNSGNDQCFLFKKRSSWMG
jgi:hypothetical protein